MYGDGNAVISFLHVDDFVEAIIKIVGAETSKVEGQLFTFAEPERFVYYLFTPF